MMYLGKKRLLPWMDMLIVLITVCMLSCIGYQVSAGEGREGIINGRNLSDFEAVGHIDSLKDDLIVIDDLQKRLSPDVQYYRQGGIRIRRSSFRAGAKVGYVTNTEGEIIALWLLR
jgi:hypothetical protein